MENITLLSLSPDLIAHRLQSAERVTVIDMREASSLIDYFIVATVQSRRAMSEAVAAMQDLAGEMNLKWHVERSPQWTLIDLDGCVVQLFTPEGRRQWHLERLWGMQPQRDIAARASVAFQTA
jgi:ribosome-associated protein